MYPIKSVLGVKDEVNEAHDQPTTDSSPAKSGDKLKLISLAAQNRRCLWTIGLSLRLAPMSKVSVQGLVPMI